MFNKIKKLLDGYNSHASDIAFYQDDESSFDWEALDALETLVAVLEKQHSEYLSRVADEYSITQIENRMLGYGGR